MTAAQSLDTFQAEQRQAIRQAVAQAIGTWRLIDVDNIVDSWVEAVPAVTLEVARAQRTSAQAGVTYTNGLAAAQGLTEPSRTVNTDRLAGIASDGRPLRTLLELPARQTLARIGSGMPVREALRVGGRQMGMLAVTQIADAGRVAASVSMTSQTGFSGYRRQITGTACSRCAILAGAFYRWNTGFERHPSCQCVHVPVVGPKSDVEGLETFDPDAYFNSMPQAEQDRIFTASGAEAIRDGADMNQVVNARRGMYSTTAYGNTVRATRTGMSGRNTSAARALRATDQRPGTGNIRLMPEQIYRDANGNRDEAIRLLGRFGYLSG